MKVFSQLFFLLPLVAFVHSFFQEPNSTLQVFLMFAFRFLMLAGAVAFFITKTVLYPKMYRWVDITFSYMFSLLLIINITTCTGIEKITIATLSTLSMIFVTNHMWNMHSKEKEDLRIQKESERMKNEFKEIIARNEQ